jgi:nicotinate-nucleotide adenylyltransferase
MGVTAVFGGSFNPPHVSHVLAVAYVLATQPVDRVLVIPTYDHPFGKSLVNFAHRHAMCALAFRDFARTEISTIEQELGGESRTLKTLNALKARVPDEQFRLVVGSDILNEAHKWFGWDQITAMAPLIVLGRVGHAAPGAPAPVIPELASRDLRAMIEQGEDVGSLVPRAVREYFAEHGLYAKT